VEEGKYFENSFAGSALRTGYQNNEGESISIATGNFSPDQIVSEAPARSSNL
jgi:hypothetical protein